MAARRFVLILAAASVFAALPAAPGAAADRADRVVKSDAEWKKILTPEQYQICRAKGTEKAFCGIFVDSKQKGLYACALCGNPLFHSSSKFHSGTGWPSFKGPVAPSSVRLEEDRSHRMERTEVLCARCDAYLGHVFPDGPPPDGDRYCINSICLELIMTSPAETAILDR